MMESLLKRGVFGAALGVALVAQAAITGSSEAAAASISMSAAGAVRTVKLVAATGTEKGVYYFKSTLKRGQSYTVWTENVSTNAPVSLDAYAADPPDTSDAMGPGATSTTWARRVRTRASSCGPATGRSMTKTPR